MANSITVSIVTRNRAKDLRECLESLSQQTLIPKKILIVNNNSVDETQNVITEFSKHLGIKEVIETQVGYPTVYNRALKETKTQWVAFIDDDCVADKYWFENIAAAAERFKDYAAISGSSKNYYSKNWCACSFQFWNDYWRYRSIGSSQVLDYRTLDSRNILYNKKLLSNYHIVFDTAFITGAEDGDVGLQIQYRHLKASVVNQAIIYHKEPKTLKTFFLKKIAYAKASKQLTKKWGITGLLSNKRKQLTLMRETFLSVTDNLTYRDKLKTFFLVIEDYIFSRFHIYERLEFFKEEKSNILVL